MKPRQIIIVTVALAILLSGKLISDKLSEPKVKPARKAAKNVTTVFVETVKNSEIPILIESTGLLEAVNRMELYSEVQGVMLPDNGRFKAGNTFSQGQALVNIRADDQRAGVIAQRSSFQRSLSAVLPDIRLDFPDEFAVWQSYLQKLKVESSVEELPEVKSEKLKLFLTGRNIYSEFYSVKNAEITLSKFSIRAPYAGLLAEANADPGTVIRPGQKLGVFIKPGAYELEASVSAANAESLKQGQEVELKMEGVENKMWKGKISRVNRAIDPQSQMSSFFVNISSNDLKDGMFLKAGAKGKSVANAFELPRSVLLNNNHVYVVENNLLVEHKVHPIHFADRTVIVNGLEDGMQVLIKIPPAAFAGMSVTIYKENSAE